MSLSWTLVQQHQCLILAWKNLEPNYKERVILKAMNVIEELLELKRKRDRAVCPFRDERGRRDTGVGLSWRLLSDGWHQGFISQGSWSWCYHGLNQSDISASLGLALKHRSLDVILQRLMLKKVVTQGLEFCLFLGTCVSLHLTYHSYYNQPHLNVKGRGNVSHTVQEEKLNRFLVTVCRLNGFQVLKLNVYLPLPFDFLESRSFNRDREVIGYLF